MLLQTNSYIVPREKRVEHARLLRRFRQTLLRLGCDHFEVYEQVGANWNTGETTGRFVQIMRFHDRKHQLAVQSAERTDTSAQALLQEFCELINFPYQQQQGLFAVGFYTSFLRTTPQRTVTVPQIIDASPSAEHHAPGAQNADGNSNVSVPGHDYAAEAPLPQTPEADIDPNEADLSADPNNGLDEPGLMGDFEAIDTEALSFLEEEGENDPAHSASQDEGGSSEEHHSPSN